MISIKNVVFLICSLIVMLLSPALSINVRYDSDTQFNCYLHFQNHEQCVLSNNLNTRYYSNLENNSSINLLKTKNNSSLGGFSLSDVINIDRFNKQLYYTYSIIFSDFSKRNKIAHLHVIQPNAP